MLVMKFGGSSLAHPARLLAALERIEGSCRHEPTVVVVSAFGDTTDLLVDDGIDMRPKRRSIVSEHESAFGLFDGELAEDLRSSVERRLDRLGRLRGADAHALGERIASELLTRMLYERGFVARDLAFEVIAVDPEGHTIDEVSTRRRWIEATADVVADVFVVCGFAGRDHDRRLRLLGRGGSDYVATGLAAAIGAHSVELWKDVDGIHDGDPRLSAHTRSIAHLTWEEAHALAQSGSQVLHPRTIEPVMRTRIPLHVRQTDAPWKPGTAIGPEPVVDVSAATADGARR